MHKFVERGSTPIFDVVVVDACHSEPLASRFLQSGASCAVGCAGGLAANDSKGVGSGTINGK